MTCRLDADDRCKTPGHARLPVEEMGWCPHDGNVCDHSSCRHPSCHRVEAKYKRDPFLGVKWFARCSLCGEKGPGEQRKDEALAWEQMHHEAVSQS